MFGLTLLVAGTRVDCGEDTLRPNSTCPHLYEVGKNLTIHPFWYANATYNGICLPMHMLRRIESTTVTQS